MKLLSIVVSITFLTFLFYIVYHFVRTIRNNSKRMEKIKLWSEFNQKLIEWGKEIKDPIIKGDYMDFALKFILHTSNPDDAVKKIDEIPEFIGIIKDKYINHIPSFREEFITTNRENKINKILNQ